MRASAEVEKLASLVNRDLFIGLGELLDEMALHEVAFALELLQPLVARQELARVRQVLLDELLHLLLDLFQVFRRERSRTIKVVEESTLGRRPVSKLGLGKKLEHRRRQQMRRRVPVDFQRLRILIRKQSQIGVFIERSSQVDQIAISLRRQRRIRQPRADGLGNIERSGAFGDFLGAPVGELDMNTLRHK